MGAFECVSASNISPTESTETFNINMSSNTTLNEPNRDLESQVENKCNNGDSCKFIWMLGTDLPLLINFLLLIGLFELGIIPGNKAGFYCNDPKLAHEYRGDTVGTTLLMSTVFGLPLLVILTVEYYFIHPEFLCNCRFQRACTAMLYLYRLFLYGLLLNIGIVEVMKGLMGNPRPTFFAICDPDAGKTCTESEFVADYNCTVNQHNWWLQSDSYRSFPSGHTSMSVYTAFFLAWYLHRRTFSWNNRSTFLLPMLTLLLISYAAVCSLTRITDHRHHWWDVLVGFIIGCLCVFYAVILGKNFTYNYSKCTRPSQPVCCRNTTTTTTPN